MMDVPLFVYLPGRGGLDRLHSLVIINNTVVNVFIHAFWYLGARISF